MGTARAIETKGYTKTSYTTRRQVKVKADRSNDFKSEDFELSNFVKRSDEICGRRDLNPHAFRRQNLNLVRLPISPRPHVDQCLKDSLFFNKKLFAKS